MSQATQPTVGTLLRDTFTGDTYRVSGTDERGHLTAVIESIEFLDPEEENAMQFIAPDYKVGATVYPHDGTYEVVSE